MRAIHGGYFDDELHQYYDSNKRPVPGVTSILKSEGLIGDYNRPDGEFYMNRGTRIHKACEQLVKGTLSWGMLDDDIFGHVEQFEAFTKAHPNLVVHRCEEGNISPLLYGRTPDIEGILNGLPVLIDIKSGPAQEWHCIQLAAYDFGHTPPRKRYILELKTDDFKLVPTSKWGKADAQYQDIWLSALNLYNFKTGKK